MSCNLSCETFNERVVVARFVRPDMRDALYDYEAIPDTALFKELDTNAIKPLPKGGTLILNFGLVDWFPTAFYRLLLRVREEVQAKGCRVMLCCLTEHVKEGFELMRGDKVFEVHSTEKRAVTAAG